MALAALAPDPALRATLLDVARTPVAKAMGKPVKFMVHRLAHDGDWAFLMADMQDGNGRLLDLVGTPLADAAANGAASHTAAVLLHRVHGIWQVAELALGPTDVAWEDWPAKHKAPRTVFGF